MSVNKTKNNQTAKTSMLETIVAFLGGKCCKKDLKHVDIFTYWHDDIMTYLHNGIMAYCVCWTDGCWHSGLYPTQAIMWWGRELSASLCISLGGPWSCSWKLLKIATKKEVKQSYSKWSLTNICLQSYLHWVNIKSQNN